MKIKVIVAAHKPYQMPKDSVYMPLHVGKEGKKSIDFEGDNTGENISAKNGNYCELTGLYWAWKNLRDADVIGLVHYRRHFASQENKRGKKWDRILTSKEMEKLMSEYDIIVPCKRNYFIETNETQYIHAHPKEDWDNMLSLVKEQYPEYSASLDMMRKSTSGHKFNMHIMKQKVLDNYCSWLFPLLEKIEEKQIEKSRILGHISERMFDVWLYANEKKYKFKEIPIMFMENQNWLVKGAKFLGRKFRDSAFFRKNPKRQQ
ncbi:MAG: DUF4422 domain-containing protein [Fibromonadales bacterium]|nr:DUF4422 domain-containing protein [Fibromonadales bacterium]